MSEDSQNINPELMADIPSDIEYREISGPRAEDIIDSHDLWTTTNPEA